MKSIDEITARKKIYLKNGYETDINFRLISKTTSRIRKALNGRLKSLSSRVILGTDIRTYRKWIEWQMTLDMNWTNIDINHVKPLCLFDVSKDEELKEAINWKNTQPLLENDHHQKSTKFIFLEYHLQFIKVWQFLRLNGQK